MARIGDTPDQQRINEQNESQRQRRVDETKRGDESRRQQAFNEVMTQKVAKKTNDNKNAKDATKEQAQTKGQEKKVLRTVRKQAKSPAELARRAALARAAKGNMTAVRGKDVDKGKVKDNERSTELDNIRDNDRERQVKDVRQDDLKEAQKSDDQVYVKVDPDAEGKQGQQQQGRRDRGGGEGSEQEGASGVAAAEGRRGANQARLPQALVEAIAKSIAIAAAIDGTAEVVVQLQGTMLEGVTLKVGNRKGKIRCTFLGCDKHTGNLIESSKGELMRALAKKGLELDILRVR